MKFKFKHAESGEIREVELTDEYIRKALTQEANEMIMTCDCDRHDYVVDCGCEDYLYDFELMEDDEKEQA